MFAMNSVYKPSGYNPEFSNRPLHNNSCSLNSNSISGVNSNRVSQSNLVTIGKYKNIQFNHGNSLSGQHILLSNGHNSNHFKGTANKNPNMNYSNEKLNQNHKKTNSNDKESNINIQDIVKKSTGQNKLISQLANSTDKHKKTGSSTANLHGGHSRILSYPHNNNLFLSHGNKEYDYSSKETTKYKQSARKEKSTGNTNTHTHDKHSIAESSKGKHIKKISMPVGLISKIN